MKLVGYCRVSTANQKEEGTIQNQVKEIESYCKENSHELVALFKDDGVSGQNIDRKGLNDMIAYLEYSLNVDGVVILKLDRLARSIKYQELIIDSLADKGYKVLSVKDQAFNLNSKDPSDLLARQMSGVFSEYEKGLITQRLTSGRKYKARAGGYAGGKLPYGYIRNNKGELAIDNEKAEVVRRIINSKIYKKYRYQKIADELNNENIPPPSGSKWYISAISRIVSNPIYRGIYTYSGITSKREDLKIVGKNLKHLKNPTKTYPLL